MQVTIDVGSLLFIASLLAIVVYQKAKVYTHSLASRLYSRVAGSNTRLVSFLRGSLLLSAHNGEEERVERGGPPARRLARALSRSVLPPTLSAVGTGADTDPAEDEDDEGRPILPQRRPAEVLYTIARSSRPLSSTQRLPQGQARATQRITGTYC